MIYKTKYFTRWARKAGLTDDLLKKAVLEIQNGLLNANLGCGLVKKRIALPGRGKRAVQEHCWQQTMMIDGFLYLVLKRMKVKIFRETNW